MEPRLPSAPGEGSELAAVDSRQTRTMRVLIFGNSGSDKSTFAQAVFRLDDDLIVISKSCLH